ncbi:MAG: hypothetical protein WC455_15220 [Dehalococcoidia bacterium]|jgi:hypothetical protein
MSNPENHQPDGIFVAGFPGEKKKYPAWRYHDWLEPIIVEDTGADEKARMQGWVEHNKPVTASRHLMNQRFDLEDLSARQLVDYARAEFGVVLPVGAGKEKLFKAIWRLSMNAPENEDRVVLMAHAIKLNYDETQLEIRKLADSETEPCEVTVQEFWA